MIKQKSKYHLAIIAANFVWALNYPFYKLLMPEYIAPVAMVAFAVLSAAIISQLLSIGPKRERVERRDILKLVGAAFLVAIVRKVMLMEGVSRTSPIDGSLINSVDPVLVLIISVLFHRDVFTRRKTLGLALGLAGTVAVILFGNVLGHKSSDLTGNIFIVVSSIASAFYLVLFKELVGKYKALTLIRVIYTIGLVMIIPIAAKSVAHVDFSAFTPKAWFFFLYIAIVPTFFPNFLLAWGLRGVPSTVGSIYSYIQPVVATALAVALHMDKLTWEAVVAAVVIFFGVGLVVTAYRRTSSGEKLELKEP